MAAPSKGKWALIFGVFLLLTSFNIFYKLDGPSVRMWDESRSGINAMEMVENGNLIVTHYKGQPDLWYAKPPLVVWIQAALFKAFGPSELTLRLHSGIAALLVCLGLMWFSIKVLNNYRIGFLAGVALVSIPGYIGHHVTRTGEADSLLILFTTAYALVTFAAYQQEKINWKYMAAASVLLGLATMTKSSAGLLITPGIFIWAMMQSRHPLKERILSMALLGSGVLMLVGFYALREWAAVGYVEVVWGTEWGGRYFGPIAEHHEPWFFLFDDLFKTDFHFAVFALPLLAVAAQYGLEPRQRSAFWFAMLVAATYLAVISVPKTKLEWYDAQVYPFLALAMGIGLVALLNRLALPRPTLLMAVLALALIGPGYYRVYRNNNSSTDPKLFENERAGYAIMDLSKHRPELKTYAVLSPVENMSAVFYAKRLAASSDINLHVLNVEWDAVPTNQELLICHDALNDSLDLSGRAVLWSTPYGCKLYGAKE